MHENSEPAPRTDLQTVKTLLLRKMGSDAKAYPKVIEQKFPHLLALFADQ